MGEETITLSPRHERRLNAGINPFITARSHDVGTSERFFQSFEDGLKTSLGTSLVDVSLYKLRGTTGNLIDQKTFDSFYSNGGQMKWKDGMTYEQADMLRKDAVKRNDRDFAMARSSGTGDMLISLAGGLLGNMADPVTIATMFIPIGGTEAALAKTGKTLVESLRVSRSFGEVGKALLRGSAIAEADAILWEPAILASQQELQSGYTFKDSLTNLAVAPMLGAGLGGGSRFLNDRYRSTVARAEFVDSLFDGNSGVLNTINKMDPNLAGVREIQQKVHNAFQKESLSERDWFFIHDQLEKIDQRSLDLGSLFKAQDNLNVDARIKWETAEKLPPNEPIHGTGEKAIEARTARRAERSLAISELFSKLYPIYKEGLDKDVTHQKFLDQITRKREAVLLPHTVADADLTQSQAMFKTVMGTLFNREVVFVRPDGMPAGVSGRVYFSSPGKIHVSTGVRLIADDYRLLGHEFWHTVSQTSPFLWQKIVRHISENESQLMAEIMERTALDRQGIKDQWARLTLGEQLDESFAEVMGRSFQNPKFWESLLSNPKNKSVVDSIREILVQFYTRLKAFVLNEDLSVSSRKAMDRLADDLGRILGKNLETIRTKELKSVFTEKQMQNDPLGFMYRFLDYSDKSSLSTMMEAVNQKLGVPVDSTRFDYLLDDLEKAQMNREFNSRNEPEVFSKDEAEKIREDEFRQNVGEVDVEKRDTMVKERRATDLRNEADALYEELKRALRDEEQREFFRKHADFVEKNPRPDDQQRLDTVAKGWGDYLTQLLNDNQLTTKVHGLGGRSALILEILAQAASAKNDRIVIDSAALAKLDSFHGPMDLGAWPHRIYTPISKRYNYDSVIGRKVIDFQRSFYAGNKEAIAEATKLLRMRKAGLIALGEEMEYLRKLDGEGLAKETEGLADAMMGGQDAPVTSPKVMQVRLQQLADQIRTKLSGAASRLPAFAGELATRVTPLFTGPEGLETIARAIQDLNNKPASAAGTAPTITPQDLMANLHPEAQKHLAGLVDIHNRHVAAAAAVDMLIQNRVKYIEGMDPLLGFESWRHRAISSHFNKAELVIMDKAGALGLANSDNPRFLDPVIAVEIYRRIRSRVEGGWYDNRIAAYMQDHLALLKNTETNALLRQASKKESWSHIATSGYKQLMSRLDGHIRKNVRRLRSVHHTMKARVAEDMTPFVQALIAEDLKGDFLAGKLTYDLMAILEGAPTRNTNADHVAKLTRVAEVWKDTFKNISYRLNEAGANIEWREGFSLRQIHNPTLMKKAGRDLWVAKVRRLIDAEATMGQKAGLSEPRVQPDGKVEISEVASIDTYLRSVWEDTVLGRPRGFEDSLTDTSGGNLAQSISNSRKLVFKKGALHDYLKEFGNPDLQNEFFQQLESMSQRSTLVETFGPNYLETTKQIKADFRATLGNEPSLLQRRRAWQLEQTLDHLTGELDHPVDQGIAGIGSMTRAITNAALLGSATLSAITDIASSVSRLRWQGMSHADASLFYAKALVEAFRRNRTNDATRAWFVGTSAGLDSLLGNVMRRFTGEVPGEVASKRLNDWIFKWNGMNFWNTAAQEALSDVMTKHLGELAISGQMPSEMGSLLSRYDITPKQWAEMSKYAAKIEELDGTARMHPDLLPPELAREALNLRAMLVDAINEGVLMPSVSDEAMLRFGTKAGTVSGEAVRTILQYRSFPLAITSKIYRRMAVSFGEEAIESWAARGFVSSGVDAAAFLGSAFVMGWLSLNLKEVLKGREPLHFMQDEQQNMENVLRVIKQSGMLGLSEEVFGYGMADLLGPAAGQALNIVSSTDDTYSFVNALAGVVPGNTLPVVNEGKKALFALAFGDAYGQSYLAVNRMLESTRGQSSFRTEAADALESISQ